MKILYITYIPSPYRVAFFKCLGKTVQLTVLFECAAEPGRDLSWKNNTFTGFEAVFLNDEAADQGKFDRSAVKFLEENAGKFDVIVVTNAISKTGSLVTTYLRKKHIDSWIEGDGAFLPDGEKSVKRLIKKHLLKGAKGYIATCDNHIEYYKKYGVKANRIYKCAFSSEWDEDVSKEPVSFEERQELKKILGIPEKKVIVYAGQFIHRKGLDVLVRAFKAVDEEAGLFLIGGSKEKLTLLLREEFNESVETIEKMLNNPRIHVIDFLLPDRLKEYYRAADCFVLPTREDIWGLVVNEAMAQGLPVIATDKCNAGLEMIEDNLIGSIVKVEDHEDLAHEINRILNLSKDERDKCSKKCLEIAQTQTIETMVRSRTEAFNFEKSITFIGSFVPNEIEHTNVNVSSAGNRFQNNFVSNLKKCGYNVNPISYLAVPFVKEEADKLKKENYILRSEGFLSSLKRFKKTVVGSLESAKYCVSYNVIYAWMFLPKLAKRKDVESILILADYSPVESFNSPVRKMYARMMLRTIRQYDTVIGLSRGVKDILKPNQKFILMEGGLDRKFYDEFKDLKVCDDGVTRIVYSGLLSHVTGVDILLDAMKKTDKPDIRLVITGKGDLDKLVRNAAKEDHRIEYKGNLSYEDYTDTLKTADFLINPRNMALPENKNNFPSKVIDYLATGKAVISTKFEGWEKFEDYMVFVNSDADSLAQVIMNVVKDKGSERLSDFSKKRSFAEEFLWEKQIEKIFNGL